MMHEATSSIYYPKLRIRQLLDNLDDHETTFEARSTMRYIYDR